MTDDKSSEINGTNIQPICFVYVDFPWRTQYEVTVNSK